MKMLIGSMVIFGTIGIFRKYIPLSSSLLACFRGLVGSIFLMGVVKLRKEKIMKPIEKMVLCLLIVSGSMIGINWILLFEAYRYTTVSVATLCYYMAPVIVIVCSPIFFKEKLTLKKGICVMIALLGMVFISGILEGQLPQTSEALGIVFGLLAAILYAVVVMLNKKLPGIDPYQKTIIQLFSAGIVLVPYVWLQTDFTMIHLNGIEWILLLFVGFVHTGIAYTLYFGSVDEIKAQTVALFSYIDPVIALILSFVILHEPMTFYGILGAICILGATIVSEL